MTDELKELLKDLDEEQREKILAKFKAAEGDDEEPEADDSEEAERMEKAAELLADKMAEKFSARMTIGGNDEDEETKDFKRRLHSFDEQENTEGIDDMVKQRQIPKEQRVARYLQAKKDGDMVYLEQTSRRIATYFKALIQGNTPVVRALVEGTDALGGYLVPEEFRAEVVQEMQNAVVMRNIAFVLPMGTDTFDIPTEAARPTVYWGTEDATIQTSSAEFGEVTLTPHKLIGRIAVTHELFQDSAIPVVRYLARIFAEEIGEKEDKAFFVGSGSGQPKGIDQETLTTVTAGSNKADSLINLFYTLKKVYRGRASWVMNTHTLRNTRKLKDSQNQYLWQPSLQAGEPEVLLGRPVYEQNDLADGKIFFGDYSYYFIGDREQMSAETTREGGTAWERDRIELKVRERVDGEVALTRAFVEGASF